MNVPNVDLNKLKDLEELYMQRIDYQLQLKIFYHCHTLAICFEDCKTIEKLK